MEFVIGSWKQIVEQKIMYKYHYYIIMYKDIVSLLHHNVQGYSIIVTS